MVGESLLTALISIPLLESSSRRPTSFDFMEIQAGGSRIIDDKPWSPLGWSRLTVAGGRWTALDEPSAMRVSGSVNAPAGEAAVFSLLKYILPNCCSQVGDVAAGKLPRRSS